MTIVMSPSQLPHRGGPDFVHLRPGTMDEVLQMLGPLPAAFFDQMVLGTILRHNKHDDESAKGLFECIRGALNRHIPRQGLLLDVRECRFILTALDRWLQIMTGGAKRLHFYVGVSRIRFELATRDWPVFTDCRFNAAESCSDKQAEDQHCYAFRNHQLRHNAMRGVLKYWAQLLLEHNCQVGKCGVLLGHLQSRLSLHPRDDPPPAYISDAETATHDAADGELSYCGAGTSAEADLFNSEVAEPYDRATLEPQNDTDAARFATGLGNTDQHVKEDNKNGAEADQAGITGPANDDDASSEATLQPTNAPSTTPSPSNLMGSNEELYDDAEFILMQASLTKLIPAAPCIITNGPPTPDGEARDHVDGSHANIALATDPGRSLSAKERLQVALMKAKLHVINRIGSLMEEVNREREHTNSLLEQIEREKEHLESLEAYDVLFPGLNSDVLPLAD